MELFDENGSQTTFLCPNYMLRLGETATLSKAKSLMWFEFGMIDVRILIGNVRLTSCITVPAHNEDFL
jgi:hypothetical protein